MRQHAVAGLLRYERLVELGDGSQRIGRRGFDLDHDLVVDLGGRLEALLPATR